jgi:colanic acid biosynthesis glycosyl transferase WcaI
MKILFITPDGFDTPSPNNQMAETMMRVFCESGHHVHLIQSHRKGINPDIPESLKSLPNFTCDTVVRKIVDKTKFVKRYLNDFYYAFQAMKYWRKVKDADVIYLQSNPTIIYPMLLLRLFKRKVPIV